VSATDAQIEAGLRSRPEAHGDEKCASCHSPAEGRPGVNCNVHPMTAGADWLEEIDEHD